MEQDEYRPDDHIVVSGGLSPISGKEPPREGRWKPGQSGNPAGRPKSKPFKDALQAILDDPHMLAKTAAALVARSHNGDVGAIKEIADRLDGKVTDTLETNSLVRVVSGWDE